MQVTEKYLERFASRIYGKPAEIPLNGYEQPATHVISVDDGNETCLAVTYRDTWPTPEPWEPPVPEGTENRETFVTIRRIDQTIGKIGYRFAGLITLDDLRAWYRRKEGITEDGNTTS